MRIFVDGQEESMKATIVASYLGTSNLKAYLGRLPAMREHDYPGSLANKEIADGVEGA